MQTRTITVQLLNGSTKQLESKVIGLKVDSDSLLEQQLLQSLGLYLQDMPELLYIFQLLMTDGYYSDKQTHVAMMHSFLEKCSYLLPMSVCTKYANKGIVREDHRIMELYQTIIMRMQAMCFQDNMLAISKQAFLQETLLQGILELPNGIELYLDNAINKTKIVGHGLVLWIRSLIEQLDVNCFDYSDYVPPQLEQSLGND